MNLLRHFTDLNGSIIKLIECTNKIEQLIKNTKYYIENVSAQKTFIERFNSLDDAIEIYNLYSFRNSCSIKNNKIRLSKKKLPILDDNSFIEVCEFLSNYRLCKIPDAEFMNFIMVHDISHNFDLNKMPSKFRKEVENFKNYNIIIECHGNHLDVRIELIKTHAVGILYEYHDSDEFIEGYCYYRGF